GCVLVAEKSNIIYKKGFGKANFEWNIPNTTDTKFEIASISKHITAIIILQLVEEGKLKLEGKITDYYPGYPKEDGDHITLQQLLLHTSGLTDSRFIEGFEEKEGMMAKAHEEHIKSFWNLPLLSEPGAKWSYSNFGYHLLAFIAETVTGKSFHQLLKERIFDKAGMKNSTTLEDPFIIPKFAPGYTIRLSEIQRGLYHDPSFTFGNGSVVTTVEDYFLFWKALIDGRLLSPKYNEMILSPKTMSDQGEVVGFSLYFDKMFTGGKDSTTILRCAGSHYGVHTLAYNFKEAGKLVVIFLNTKNSLINVGSPIMFEIADNITRILYDLPYQQPKDSYARIFYQDELKYGSDYAMQRFHILKKSNLCREHFAYFNRLGYFYLDHKKNEAAVEVFKLNVQTYPSNGDTYDSLGEGYMVSGNKKLAIENYKKSVSLDSTNVNARSMLKTLEAND
ncbi:MAG: serine hydrolase, partial [Saprospiraceae bacterium]